MDWWQSQRKVATGNYSKKQVDLQWAMERELKEPGSSEDKNADEAKKMSDSESIEWLQSLSLTSRRRASENLHSSR